MGYKIRTVLGSALIFGLSGVSYAEIPNDFHIQSDRFDMEEEMDTDISRYHYRYVEWLLEQDYPIPSIILHAVSRGMTMSDIVYLLIKADPTRGLEVYNQAIEMLPTLPGWVCQSDYGNNDRYNERFTSGQTQKPVTVKQIADRYFNSNEQFAPYPNWKQGDGHIDAKIDELIEIVKASQAEDGSNDWWYLPYNVPIDGKTPLFISLYSYDKRIVIDANLELLEELKASGTNTVPVVFVYNADNFIPTSKVEFASDENQLPSLSPASLMGDDSAAYINNADGEISASEVMYRYFAQRMKVTPPREWHQIDHHLSVKTKELTDLFPISDQSAIPESEWNAIAEMLKTSGFKKPVIITLFGDTGEKWIDDDKWIAVANSMNIEQIPTVFLYHESTRYACGVPAACNDGVCEAAIAAGADPSVCKPKPTPQITVPPVVPPPTEPPLPPEEPPVDNPPPKFPPPRGPASHY